MFGKAKRSSHEKDEPLPPAPQLQESASANLGKSEFNGNLLHWSRHDSCRQDFR